MQTMMLRPRVMRARCPAMRSTPDNKASVTAVDVPPSEAKMKSTLSSLDALLGTDSVKEAAASRPQETPRAPVASTSYTPASTPSAAQTQQSWQTTATPAKKQTKNFNFDEIMGFDGLAPEIINGRAAMLGFIAAMMGELSTGESVFSQLVAGGGLKMLAIIGVVLVASFAPAIRKMPFDEMFGKDKHPLIFGPFNPNAEVRNGRAAMLGLLALFFIEGTSSQGFFM